LTDWESELNSLAEATTLVGGKQMFGYRKTPAAAGELKTTYHRLYGLIRFGKIQTPETDSSGDYVWTDEDINRARQALRADRHGKEVPV